MMPLLNTAPPENAQGKVKEAYAIFENMKMPVPLPMQMLSASPDYLSIQTQMLNYFMSHPSLSQALLAHIRLLASHEENYAYCVHLNSQILTQFIGLSEDQVAAAIKDPHRAALEPKEKALLLFVLKILRDPALTRQEDTDQLKEQGWSDSDILDATLMGMNMMATGILFKAFKMGEPAAV